MPRLKCHVSASVFRGKRIVAVDYAVGCVAAFTVPGVCVVGEPGTDGTVCVHVAETDGITSHVVLPTGDTFRVKAVDVTEDTE